MFADLPAAIAGTTAPPELQRQLVLLDVAHWDFNYMERTGQIVVHETLSDETLAIFDDIFQLFFPIQSMIPMAAFGDDDDASMAANNTSAFCYRAITGGTMLSPHSFGGAIDINPALNPYTGLGGTNLPPGAVYDPDQPGVLSRKAGRVGSKVIDAFERHGWFWLGRRDLKTDRHHFEKPGYRPLAV